VDIQNANKSCHQNAPPSTHILKSEHSSLEN
jgi:hypothetical protein